MAQYATDKAGAVTLLALVAPNPEALVDEAMAGPAVYGPGFMVARFDGRYNGQDVLVSLPGFDKRPIEEMSRGCTCREAHEAFCPVHGQRAQAPIDPEAWVGQ